MSGGYLYEFGPYQFDPSGLVLVRDARIDVHLEPKPASVLRMLLESAGEVVERRRLLDEIWPDEGFPDASLNRAISKLKETLRSGKNGPEYIETVSKRGYRFVIEVRTVLPGKFMLAVLPFENLSAEQDQQYFSRGLTAEMITELGRLNPERMGVIALTTVMHPELAGLTMKEIGRKLRVAYALTGSVRRAGHRVRINAQLIQMSDQTQVWAESYDRKLVDILTAQTEVAMAIAREIEIKLAPREVARLRGTRPVDPQAYDDYLRGRDLWNERTPKAVREAAAMFEKAIARDPESATAWSALADCYAALGSQSWMAPREASRKAREAARRALKIDSNFAEPHACLGFCLTVFEYQWRQAEKEFRLALDLNPNYATAHHWYSFYLAAMGRMSEALAAIRRAQRIDQLSRMINTNAGTMLYWARQYDAAIEQCRAALRIDPDFWNAHAMLAMALEQKEQYTAAIGEYRQAIDNFPGRSAILIASLARACALAGDHKQTHGLLRKLDNSKEFPSVPQFQVGLAHAAMGDSDAAFRRLRESHKAGEMWLAYIKVDPRMDDLRQDRRYRELKSVMGFKAAN